MIYNLVMKSKDKLFILITLIYTAFMLFPPFALFPVELMSVGVVLLLFVLFPQCLRDNYFKWSCLYIAVLFVYCIFHHNFHINGIGRSMNLFNKLMIETAWILPNILICSIIRNTNNAKVFRIVGIGLLVIISISFLFMLPSVLAGGNVLRINVRLTESGERGNILLPSYTLMSSYSFLLPVACYGIKYTKRFLKYYFVALTVLIVYMVVKSEITTSFLASCFVLLFTLSYRKNIQNLPVIFVTMAVIMWLIYISGALLAFVDYLISLYDGTVAQIKFIEFRDMLLGSDEDDNLTVREFCRKMSMDCFYANPLTGSPDVGGHSSLLDRLGSMGLLGFIPFVMMLITNIQMWIRFLPDKGTKFFYFSGIFIIFVFLYNKGLFSGQGMLILFVVLPVAIYGIYLYVNKVSISKTSY